MKRVTWFVSGAVAGAAGASYAKKKVKATASQLAPVHVAKGAAGRVRGGFVNVGDAVREGRSAMKAKEAELRARIDGRAVSLEDELVPGDQVLVDGRPVAPGQVVVLRQMRDADGHRRAHPRTSGGGRRRRSR
jgi:hypothetical protein